tara:strand:- start:3691 stop:4836 length:1146 start_codon:yes stop_codon:yes gene_type:complete
MAIVAGRGVSTGRAQADVTSGRNNADVSQREDLANFITMITREETPFLSSIGKAKATAIYHEWQTDELATPGNSKLAEGTDYVTPGDTGAGDYVAGAHLVGPLRSRLGNYTQINGKSIAVSGTRRAVDQAGVADEYAYQLKKRGTELRRDVEFDMVHSYNVASGAGTRTAGGFQAYIQSAATVDYLGEYQAPSAAGTAAGTDNAGISQIRSTIAGAGTAPDRDPLALANIDSVMQKIYQEGGKATRIMLSPKLRRDFSDLMVGDTGVRRNIDGDGKLRQSVDVYMSDFGDIMVVPNYIMGLSNVVAVKGENNVAHTGTGRPDVADFAALIYDPMWFNVATLRPLTEVDVGQKGDSTVGMMIEETTLEVRNPKGCGAIYGLE